MLPDKVRSKIQDWMFDELYEVIDWELVITETEVYHYVVTFGETNSIRCFRVYEDKIELSKKWYIGEYND